MHMSCSNEHFHATYGLGIAQFSRAQTRLTYFRAEFGVARATPAIWSPLFEPSRTLSECCPSGLERFFPGHNFLWTNRRIFFSLFLKFILTSATAFSQPNTLIGAPDPCQVCTTSASLVVHLKSPPRPAHVPTSSQSISNYPPDQPSLLKSQPLPRPKTGYIYFFHLTNGSYQECDSNRSNRMCSGLGPCSSSTLGFRGGTVPVHCNGSSRVVGEITLDVWVRVHLTLHPSGRRLLFHRRRRTQNAQRGVAFLSAKNVDARGSVLRRPVDPPCAKRRSEP